MYYCSIIVFFVLFHWYETWPDFILFFISLPGNSWLRMKSNMCHFQVHFFRTERHLECLPFPSESNIRVFSFFFFENINKYILFSLKRMFGTRTIQTSVSALSFSCCYSGTAIQSICKTVHRFQLQTSLLWFVNAFLFCGWLFFYAGKETSSKLPVFRHTYSSVWVITCTWGRFVI